MAQEGFTDGEKYFNCRGAYSEEAVAFVTSLCKSDTKVDTEYDVLELGAGPGNFTRSFYGSLPSGTKYIALEPSEGFRTMFAKSIPNVRIVSGNAADIPLSDHSVNNIVAAQCFHFFANEESLKEIHRVLVPGGKFIAIWNAFQFEEMPWAAYFSRLLTEERSRTNTPCYVSLDWRKVIRSSSLFRNHHEEFSNWQPKFTIDSWIDLVVTHSLIVVMTDMERAVHVDKMRAEFAAATNDADDSLLATNRTHIHYSFAVQ